MIFENVLFHLRDLTKQQIAEANNDFFATNRQNWNKPSLFGLVNAQNLNKFLFS